MSGGDRDRRAEVLGLGIAAIAALAWSAMLWQMSANEAKRTMRAEHKAASYAQDTENRILNACRATDRAAFVRCATKEIDTSHENQRAEYDLSAQQDMAEWAKWMLLAGLLTLIVTGIGVWFVRETLRATLKAVQDTSEATDAMVKQNKLTEESQRAWLIINDIKVLTVARKGDGIHVSLSWSVINTGQTPATLASFDVCVFEEARADIDGATIIDRAIKRRDSLMVDGGSIGPGETRHVKRGESIHISDLDATKDFHRFKAVLLVAYQIHPGPEERCSMKIVGIHPRRGSGFDTSDDTLLVREPAHRLLNAAMT